MDQEKQTPYGPGLRNNGLDTATWTWTQHHRLNTGTWTWTQQHGSLENGNMDVTTATWTSPKLSSHPRCWFLTDFIAGFGWPANVTIILLERCNVVVWEWNPKTGSVESRTDVQREGVGWSLPFQRSFYLYPIDDFLKTTGHLSF